MVDRPREPSKHEKLQERVERLRESLAKREARVEALRARVEHLEARLPDPELLRTSLPAAAALIRTRGAVVVPDIREREFAACSPAYRDAIDGPHPDGTVARLIQDGITWWTPPAQPRTAGEPRTVPRFPYRGIIATRQFPLGGIMLDLGAHTGRMSIPRVLLGDAAAAYCAEPDPTTYLCLVSNVRDNRLRGFVMPDRTAIGDYDGVAHLERAGWSGEHRLAGSAAGSATIEVACSRLDTWADRLRIDPQQVSFIKVDTQGSELRVLRGAPGILRHRHILWQVEIEPRLLETSGTSLRELCSELQRAFTHFIDIGRRAGREAARPTSDLPDAVAYLEAGEATKTDLLLFSAPA